MVSRSDQILSIGNGYLVRIVSLYLLDISIIFQEVSASRYRYLHTEPKSQWGSSYYSWQKIPSPNRSILQRVCIFNNLQICIIIISPNRKIDIENHQQNILYFLLGEIQQPVMINQLKKTTSPPNKIEDNPIVASILNPGKFQRTNRRLITSPQQTATTSEKTQSVLTQEVKTQQPAEKPKIIARTNRLNEKRQQIKSPAPEQAGSVINQRVKTPMQMSSSNILSQTKPSPLQKSEEKSLISLQTIPKTESQSKIQVPNINLKKSIGLFYVVRRLLAKRGSQGFIKLKQHYKIQKLKSDNESKLLLLRSYQISSKYILNLNRQIFDKLKINYQKQQKDQFQIQGQTSKTNHAKTKENLPNLLQIAYKIKIRQTFSKLKTNLFFKINCFRAAPVLADFYERRKIRQTFESLRLKSSLLSTRKYSLFNQIVKANLHCSKQQLIIGFNKILFFSRAISKGVQTKPVQITNKKQVNRTVSTSNLQENSQKTNEYEKKIQKLNTDKQKSQRDIGGVESKIQKLKKQQENQVKKLKKAIQDLKVQKKKVQKQVSDKKLLNSQLTQKTQNKVQKSVNEEIQSIEVDTKANVQLSNLQQIYSDFNKDSNDDIKFNIDKILKQNNVTIKYTNNIITQWSLVQKRSQLQKQIQLYQRSILGQSPLQKEHTSVVRLIREQNDMVRNMIKNYIKQRYLWNEVEKFVATVL